MGPANLPDRAATSGKANEDRLDNLDVQEESAAVRCRVAATLARDGGEPRALWLSTIDRAIAARRLESQCEAHLPAVHGGAVDGAHQAAAQERSASAGNHGHGHSAKPMLEHGFYERQAVGRAFLPHSDGGGPVHAGVHLSGSGSRHDGNARSPGAGESQGRARTSADQHYGGQWQ